VCYDKVIFTHKTPQPTCSLYHLVSPKYGPQLGHWDIHCILQDAQCPLEFIKMSWIWSVSNRYEFDSQYRTSRYVRQVVCKLSNGLCTCKNQMNSVGCGRWGAPLPLTQYFMLWTIKSAASSRKTELYVKKRVEWYVVHVSIIVLSIDLPLLKNWLNSAFCPTRNRDGELKPWWWKVEASLFCR